jgi:hypothetical protein
LVDEIDDVEEPDASAATDAVDRDAERQMGLPRAGRSSDTVPSIRGA